MKYSVEGTPLLRICWYKRMIRNEFDRYKKYWDWDGMSQSNQMSLFGWWMLIRGRWFGDGAKIIKILMIFAPSPNHRPRISIHQPNKLIWLLWLIPSQSQYFLYLSNSFLIILLYQQILNNGVPSTEYFIYHFFFYFCYIIC